MTRYIHLVSNAHIDPMWQWDWDEGAAAAVSTFRCAADFCDEYEGYVFCHNEALLYQWIEEYEPELFTRIQNLVREGKWHIMGGWYIQPDCNMPSGEAMWRQIEYGRRYFKEKFNVMPNVALNFDSFGHARGLVQIMTLNGYDSYIHTRPGGGALTLPSDTYRWIGYCGSEVIGHRALMYGNIGGQALDCIKGEVGRGDKNGITLALWGVGDHGGGASRKDLDDIAVYIDAMEKEGARVAHSTPEKYFTDLRTKTDVSALPEWRESLRPWAVGCYTSQRAVKKAYAELENELFAAETIAMHAAMLGRMEYPEKELDTALCDLLLAQFHDYMTGTCTRPVEQSCVRKLLHGLEIVSRVRTRAFFALCGDQRAAESDEIPMLVYNPHPYEVSGVFECEFMMWNQNWGDSYDKAIVYSDGNVIPSQQVREDSSIPIEWRKRIAFAATLKPMSVGRFDCKFERTQSRIYTEPARVDGAILLKSGDTEVRISTRDGLIKTMRRKQGDRMVDYIAQTGVELHVYDDDHDPWGMEVTSFPKYLGRFTLLDDETASEWRALPDTAPNVKVTEDGDVYTRVEAVFGYKSSRAVMIYTLPRDGGELDVNIEVFWNEKQKMLKLAVPCAFEDADVVGQQMYAVEELKDGLKENVAQRFVCVNERGDSSSNNSSYDNRSICVINNGVYGSSYNEGVLYMSLLRSTGYTAHPLGDRRVLPSDRYSPHAEQGERCFSFRIVCGNKNEILNTAWRKASVFNQYPKALSFFPSGNDFSVNNYCDTAISSCPAAVLDAPECVELTAMYMKEGKVTARLFNSSDKDTTASVSLNIGDTAQRVDVTLKGYEIRTISFD